MNITGQKVLIMGGSSGIGEATAAAFLAAGADVMITGRDTDRLEAAAAGLRKGTGLPGTAPVDGVPPRTGGLRTARVDGSSPDGLEAFFRADSSVVHDHLVLALSSGSGGGAFRDLDLSALRGAFEGKFWAHLTILQAALDHLASRASITFLTAASARAALPGTSGLAAVNGALEAVVRPLAGELRPRRVNAVSPGVVDTPWWQGMPDAQRDALFAAHSAAVPVGRVGAPQDIAQAVLMVATNGFMTGSVVECAGGLHLATGW